MEGNSPFSHNRGAWHIEDSRIHVMALHHAEAMTGNYFMRDNVLTPSVQDRVVLMVRDDAYPWGMAGYAMYDSGRAELSDITSKEV